MIDPVLAQSRRPAEPKLAGEAVGRTDGSIPSTGANCDCGATTEGKWAGVHSYDCASLGLSDEIEKLRAALEPFTKLGGPDDGVMPAYHDLEDDVVIYADPCVNPDRAVCITAGDIRAARDAIGILHAPKRR